MSDKSTSEQIDDIIQKHGGWKAAVLTQLRETITKADPEVYEEVKWKMATRPEGLPVWSSRGIVCFAEIWNDNVKLLFPHGAALNDKDDLFNARLKSKTTRAIEFHDGDAISETALKDLIKQAVAFNGSKS